MPPKTQKKGAPPKKNQEDLKREETLQAVLLADSFQIRFRPITAEKPKVLLPLVNIPMIEYTLEFLAAGGVQEIFILCCAHANQIDEYIRNSEWSKRKPQLSVQTIISEDSHSAGDALRHLESQDLIRGDFILISGDVVSNIKLDRVLKAHKERSKEDKNNIMTVVFKQMKPDHRSRTADDDAVVVLSESNNRILLYENDSDSKFVNFDISLFEEAPAVNVRYDLMDTHIYICDQQVLMLFSDNPDYEDLRKFLIPGVLGDQEILNHKIYAHVISGEYAARVLDMHTYDSISKDIIKRWTHPIVLDNNLFCHTTYKFERHNIYKETKNVFLARSCSVLEDSVIGSGTSISEKTIIKQSIIGRNCKIGKNCSIVGCYLWDGCVVEDGVTMEQSICCDRVIVRSGAILGKGTVLSFNVVIGPEFKVKPYTLLSTVRVTEEDGFDDAPVQQEELVFKESEVGKEGKGAIYVDPEEKIGVHSNSIAAVLQTPNVFWPEEEEEIDPGEEEHHEEEDETKETDQGNSSSTSKLGVGHRSMSDGSEPSSGKKFVPSESKKSTKKANFDQEVRETLSRGVAENLEMEGLVLEMAALKLGSNAEILDYLIAVFEALFVLSLTGATGLKKDMDKLDFTKPIKLGKSILDSLQKLLKKFHPAIKKFVNSTYEQVLAVRALESVCVKENLFYEPLFKYALQFAYNQELILEDAIFEWEKKVRKEVTSGPELVLLEKAKTFLDWLREAEEEDDEEEEEQTPKKPTASTKPTPSTDKKTTSTIPSTAGKTTITVTPPTKKTQEKCVTDNVGGKGKKEEEEEDVYERIGADAQRRAEEAEEADEEDD